MRINGRNVPRIPNTSHLSFQGVDAEPLLISLDQRGIYASSGSACMSGSREPSYVLKAMGQSDEEANSAVRISLGRSTTIDEFDFLVETLKDAVDHLRKLEKNKKEKVSVPV